MHLSQRQLFLQHVGQTSDAPLMLEIDRAEGVFLYEGTRRYFDLISGVSVSNIGHRHPAVLAALEQQMQHYLHLMVYGEYVQSPQVEFAQLLAAQLPEPLQSVYFVNSGSEANEAAMKLAKRHTGRPNVVAFRRAYHGSTQGLMSLISDENWTRNFRPLLPGIDLLDYNSSEQLHRITRQTACVLVEAVQAEAGAVPADAAFMQALAARCRETGALLIFDEVQTGFGRTGRLFGFEHYGLVPDAFTIAKGMGGGMPIGAVVASRELLHSFTHSPVLGHITTFGGHPLSAAAAVATLRTLLADDLLAQVPHKAALFGRLAQHPRVQSISGQGLLMAVDLGSFDLVRRFIHLGLEEGFVSDWFLFNDTSFRIAPPLTITEPEIEELLLAIERALDRL